MMTISYNFIKGSTDFSPIAYLDSIECLKVRQEHLCVRAPAQRLCIYYTLETKFRRSGEAAVGYVGNNVGYSVSTGFQTS